MLNRLRRRLRPKSGPVVETRAGSVAGFTEDHIDHFLGVPYAAPPVGPRRWRAPAPVEPWTGVLPCVTRPPAAFQRIQDIRRYTRMAGKALGLSYLRRKAMVALAPHLLPEQSEDCLTLNVRAPARAQGLPVMVWIHGGDHTDGSGSDLPYHGDALPERGCVLVTMNYRLGLFGFFAHPDLAAESPDGVSGNYGLLDQIAALEWVRDNIAAFGGDADRVTVFGESAGGQAVLNLMSAPRARGLFHRAIAQSPSDRGRWLHLRRPVLGLQSAESASTQFADDVVGPGPGQVERLRALDPEELSERYRDHVESARHFYPAIDGAVLPEAPMVCFSERRQAPVPMLIGYNADEGSLLAQALHPAGPEFPGGLDETYPPEDVRDALDRSFGSPTAADEVLAVYPGLDRSDPEARIRYTGDHLFGVHVDHASRQHAAAGHDVYRYHFRAPAPSPSATAGAFHGAELRYVFGTEVPLFPAAPDAHLLTREMGDRWYAFAATGDPAFPGRAPWPAYGPVDPVQMVFDRPASGPEPVPDQPGLDLLRARIEHLRGVLTEPTSQV